MPSSFPQCEVTRLALYDTSRRLRNLAALDGRADITGATCGIRQGANDPKRSLLSGIAAQRLGLIPCQ